MYIIIRVYLVACHQREIFCKVSHRLDAESTIVRHTIYLKVFLVVSLLSFFSIFALPLPFCVSFPLPAAIMPVSCSHSCCFVRGGAISVPENTILCTRHVLVFFCLLIVRIDRVAAFLVFWSPCCVFALFSISYTFLLYFCFVFLSRLWWVALCCCCVSDP